MGALNVICVEIKTSFVFQEFNLKFTTLRKIFQEMREYSNLTQQMLQTLKKKKPGPFKIHLPSVMFKADQSDLFLPS